jgi:hypothetical protein
MHKRATPVALLHDGNGSVWCGAEATCDSVQLASLQALNLELPDEIRFACHDSRLVKAARVLGIESA